MTATVGQAAAAESANGAERGRRSISRRRVVAVDALIGLTTLLALVGIFSIWANRVLFNPSNWANTSTQLIQDEKIRSGAANYLVDQLYANVNVAGILRSGLPPALDPLAGPAAGALRNLAGQETERALSRPRIQTLWANANRAAAQTYVAIVDGGKGAVAVNGGAVTLDLGSILDQVASRLGLPANLGAKLPPSVAHLTVLKADQIKFVQNSGRALKHLALTLTILVPLLYMLAVALARGRRRRVLMSVGFSIVLAGLLALLGRSIFNTQVTHSLVKQATLVPTVADVLAISTGMLRDIADAFVGVGVLTVLAGWFAGPARPMTAARRAIAPFLRERPEWTFGVVVALLALIFLWQPIPATGTPAGIIVFSALALFGTAMLRRETMLEFPDARAGDAAAALHTYREATRGKRHRSGTNGSSVPEQLERLAALQERGAITTEEYGQAKAGLLGTSPVTRGQS